MIDDQEMKTAEATLKEITADNATLRVSNVLQEKSFDVQVEDLCEMRDDTKLIVVDIPGLNEAGSQTKYKNYVAKNWHTFDCVIVVMDAKQGVNTEDQVYLLQFVKDNLSSKKDLPVIILGNKVD
jgi:predicted GTPase